MYLQLCLQVFNALSSMLGLGPLSHAHALLLGLGDAAELIASVCKPTGSVFPPFRMQNSLNQLVLIATVMLQK